MRIGIITILLLLLAGCGERSEQATIPAPFVPTALTLDTIHSLDADSCVAGIPLQVDAEWKTAVIARDLEIGENSIFEFDSLPDSTR